VNADQTWRTGFHFVPLDHGGNLNFQPFRSSDTNVVFASSAYQLFSFPFRPSRVRLPLATASNDRETIV